MINVPKSNVVASSTQMCVRPGSVKSKQSPRRKLAVASLTGPKEGCRNGKYCAFPQDEGRRPTILNIAQEILDAQTHQT